MNPTEQYKAKLAEMMAADDADNDELADSIRDELDVIWYNMSAAERAELQ